MTTDESPVQRLSAVALALETVAAAAAAADADELRACEERLSQAVGAMPTPDDFVGVSRTATRAQLQRITFALARCRAIGRPGRIVRRVQPRPLWWDEATASAASARSRLNWPRCFASRLWATARPS